MYRGRHLATNSSVYIKSDEIVSAHNIVLNIKTGRIRNRKCSGIVELSGTPIAVYKSITGTICIKYDDHLDEFAYNNGGYGMSLFRVSFDDKNYLGSYSEFFGSNYTYRIGNDLKWNGGALVDAFKNCKKFLYVTVKENELAVAEHTIHYIDLDGNYHGHKPRLMRKGKYFIILDKYFCITDGEDAMVIYYEGIGALYDMVVGLDINYIEIHDDVCRIYTPDDSYIVKKEHFEKIEDQSLSLFPESSIPIKSARST